MTALRLRIETQQDVAAARAAVRAYAHHLELPVVEQIRLASPAALLAALLVESGLRAVIRLDVDERGGTPELVLTVDEVRGADGRPGRLAVPLEVTSAIMAATGMEPAASSDVLAFRKPLAGPIDACPPWCGTDDAPPALARQQREDLLTLLEELAWREGQVRDLSRELDDTNRGVLALYDELEDRATRLRRLNELQARFHSHMTHEFRTPLTAIHSLSQLLLDRMDGELSPEQEVQVRYIQRAAQDLTGLIDDLLELARAEANALAVRPAGFQVDDVLRTLRGLMRTLAGAGGVELVVELPSGVGAMTSDEGRVAQILRNLVSNALKFTERGEVRVTAQAVSDDAVLFRVADTGVGIAPEDQERIFDEFQQVDMPQQRRVKGSGLGLPLSRRLAELLGGTLSVASAPGAGSIFTLVLPRVLPKPATPGPSDRGG
jgi:signal transduction histidine kinase